MSPDYTPRKGVLNGVPDAPGRSTRAFVWQVYDGVICSVRERRREPGPSGTTGTTSSAKIPIGMALGDLGTVRTVTAREEARVSQSRRVTLLQR